MNEKGLPETVSKVQEAAAADFKRLGSGRLLLPPEYLRNSSTDSLYKTTEPGV